MIGYAMLAAPFVGLFVFIVFNSGWGVAVSLYGIVAALVAFIGVAAALIDAN
jgi:hypothetical protein